MIERDPYYVEPRRIDYERMSREFPKQKAALTRAQKKGLEAVVTTAEKTVDAWDEIGAWPDDWHRWARALEDAWRKALRDSDDLYYDDAVYHSPLADRVRRLVDRGLR